MENRSVESLTDRQTRLIGLDWFRIFAAFVVFLFHSAIHIGCDYGILQPFVTMGAVFMTGFFMMSGFLMFYTNRTKNLSDIHNIAAFYKKRVSDTVPLYLVVAALYVLLIDQKNLVNNLILAPIEVLGLQSVFSTLFPVSHNGGTWFISCLLICYAVFPFISETVKQMNARSKVVTSAIAVFLLLYSPLVVERFDLNNIYSNPFFRLLEFSLGVILAASIDELHKYKFIHKVFSSKLTVLLEVLVLVVSVTIAVKLNIGMHNYMLYNWICIPVFIMLIYSLASIPIKGGRYKITGYLSSISYAFFFAQFFTWPIVKQLIQAGYVAGNFSKIAISFAICLLLSVGMHELVEKPVKRLHRKRTV